MKNGINDYNNLYAFKFITIKKETIRYESNLDLKSASIRTP